jgi:hypothetical protein
MPRADGKVVRVLWSQLVANDETRGRWVALDDVRYDELSREPLDGCLIDADDDVAALCARIQLREGRACSILFCEESERGARRHGRRIGAPCEGTRPSWPPAAPPSERRPSWPPML